MFQFRRFPAHDYFIHRALIRYCRIGFPHSDISGSLRMCRSPKLFAACHVLLRLLMPRHSPCALSCLTNFSIGRSLVARSLNYAGFLPGSFLRNRYPLFQKFFLLLPCLSSFLCSVFNVHSLVPGWKQVSAPGFRRSLKPVFKTWWALVGSNHRPYDYQSYALAS